MMPPVTPLSPSVLPVTPSAPPEGTAAGPSPFAQMLQQRQTPPAAPQGTSGTPAPRQATPSAEPSAPSKPQPEAQDTPARAAADEAQTQRTGPRGGKAGATSQRLGRKPDGLAQAQGKETSEAKGPDKDKDRRQTTQAADTDPDGTPAWPMPLAVAPAALARLAEAARKEPAEGEGPVQAGAMRTAATTQPGSAGPLPAGPEGLHSDEATAAPVHPTDAAKAGSIEAAGMAMRGEGPGRSRPEERTEAPEASPIPFDKQLAGLLGQDGRTARADAPARDTDRTALAAAPGHTGAFATHLPATRPVETDTHENLGGLREAKVGSVGEPLGLVPHTMPAATALHPASDAAVPTLAVATPVQSPEFSQVLATHVSVLARDGVQEASLQLNPAELGPISVHIAMDGAQARVEFAVDSAVTRQAIEAGLPELASALREAGLTLSGGGVSHQNSPSAQQQASSRQGGGESFGGEPSQGRHGPEPGAARAPRRQVTMNQGGVDLYA